MFVTEFSLLSCFLLHICLHKNNFVVFISFATLLLNSYLSSIAPDGERLSAFGKKKCLFVYILCFDELLINYATL